MAELKVTLPDGAILHRNGKGVYALQVAKGMPGIIITQRQGVDLLQAAIGPMELDYIAKALDYDNAYLDEQENIVWQRLVRAGLARIKPAHSLDMGIYVINTMGKRVYKELKLHV